ncbi:hypothetical protein [Thiocapsa rosea]|nr:hypothetical protein [Thiocapsa rosea]
MNLSTTIKMEEAIDFHDLKVRGQLGPFARTFSSESLKRSRLF